MTDKNIREFYEKYHYDGIDNPVADFMQKERCQVLKKLLKNESGNILVVGCGSQNEMSIVNDEAKATGIDISEVAIKKARKQFPQFNFTVADATKLPFGDKKFDCVVCSEVIEHIKDRDKALSEIKRVLKEGGTFIITTPNWWSWYGLARFFAEKLFSKPFTSGDQPIDNWSNPKSLKKEISKAGFKIISFKGIWYHIPFGKGKKQIPQQITLPLVKFFYPLDLLLGYILPWFGHMILIKSKDDYEN
jgi:ubiquinone/menaquinone biosynthesis C-methylase UbiE